MDLAEEGYLLLCLFLILWDSWLVSCWQVLLYPAPVSPWEYWDYRCWPSHPAHPQPRYLFVLNRYLVGNLRPVIIGRREILLKWWHGKELWEWDGGGGDWVLPYRPFLTIVLASQLEDFHVSEMGPKVSCTLDVLVFNLLILWECAQHGPVRTLDSHSLANNQGENC